MSQPKLKPIAVRNLVIDPPLLLAPMVALTHTVLRQIIAGFGGAGLLSTEMLSARRLPVENPLISPYLIRTPSEKPLSYQIMTSHAGEIPRAMDALHRFKADAIDLNMGCTAPAVRKSGAGVKLMDQPGDVRAIVAEARKRTELPLTAKIRLGDDADGWLFRDFCVMLQDEGIDMLSVHGRLKADAFSRKPRWERIGEVKTWLTIPVIANGGIFSVQDASECLRVSGVDGLMLARGAVIRPWLFADIARELSGSASTPVIPSLSELYEKFIELLILHFPPEHRLRRLQQFTRYFAKNYAFGHYLATRVVSSATLEEARERAFPFFQQAEKASSLPIPE